jgi:PhnB protein
MSGNFAPEGWHSVTPRIVAEDAKGLVGFVKDVFGADGDYCENVPSEIRIGDSIVMITDAGVRLPMPAFLYVYVSDAGEAYRRSLDAGARSIEAPVDTPYGDHRCMVEDRWGNTWQIANRIR